MYGWGALDFRISLAKKYHGYSISAESYEFCPHLAQLDNLDFTLSQIYIFLLICSVLDIYYKILGKHCHYGVYGCYDNCCIYGIYGIISIWYLDLSNCSYVFLCFFLLFVNHVFGVFSTMWFKVLINFVRYLWFTGYSGYFLYYWYSWYLCFGLYLIIFCALMVYMELNVFMLFRVFIVCKPFIYCWWGGHCRQCNGGLVKIIKFTNAQIELQGTTQNFCPKNLGSLNLFFSRVAPTKTWPKIIKHFFFFSHIIYSLTSWTYKFG